MPPAGRPLIALKDLFWLLYLGPLRLTARCLPCALFLRLGRGLVPLFQALTRRAQRQARQRWAALADRLPDGTDHRRLARHYIRGMVVRSLDDLVLARLARHGRIVCTAVVGQEHLEAALAGGRGAILLSPHFYASRVAKRWLAGQDRPVMSIRNRQPTRGSMGRLVGRQLQDCYVRFLEGVIGDEVFAQDPECSLKILRRLRQGGLVNVHLDGATSRDLTSLPFLDRARHFPHGFLEIARLAGAPVLPFVCLGDSHDLRIHFGPPFELAPANRPAEFAAANLPHLVAWLETVILQHPQEWELWSTL